MVDYALLKKLCLADGISGDEGSVRKIIIDEIKDLAEWRVDSLGNLLVHKKGKATAKARLMLSAHMDEVGLMVTDITSDGFLKFDEVGGIDRRVLVGKQVAVGKNNVPGVIGIKPVHLCKGDENKTIPEYGDMYIDIGADSLEEALSVVNYGDSIHYVSDFIETETSINSKAIDDRFGCYFLIELIKSELDYDMDFAFVVQEEVGLRGAKTAAYTEIDKSKQVCTLGGGAVISVMDRRTIYDKEMVSFAFDIAEQIGAKAQYKRAVAGGNDSGAIHQSRGGVRTLAISLPCRYLHAPSTVAAKSDCESIFSLAKEISIRIAGGALKR